ncbi:MAG TPA: membrane protein insertion efficiency factor YidD [Gammaproteobacteria bacterium]|nr:MAG: membrane protein insertion efficiency factor YidD [Gammaproteobacteria bacterium TMED134]RZO70491.1 MAG: membrane protein insertion efficiency factor YidD [OM182 bacterium]HAL42353.1 membrane protein insertion efficiency factor YidD [Gammaproteobacteria bacterium]HBK17445.1 membrane protein insertion efficiency factor YidD [Gammaproteobacteria bacterium]
MLSRCVLRLIWVYQKAISPLLGPRCRFYPSCSTYLSEAVRIHGVVTGLRLGLLRLSRCHPLHPGGVDLVPLSQNEEREKSNVTS